MNWNVRAAPVDPLYDTPTPTAPGHIRVRYAIHKHRNEHRPPVMLGGVGR